MPKSRSLAAAIRVSFVLIFAAGLNGCGTGTPAQLGGTPADPVVVRSGDTRISRSTLEHWERAVRLGAVQSPGASIRARAIGYLISGSWLIEEAKKEHLAIPPDGPAQWIDQRLRSKSGKGQELETRLAMEGITRGDLEFEAKIALSAAALRKAVIGHLATASSAELESFYEHHRDLFFHERRSVDLIERLPSRSNAAALAKKLGTGPRFTKRAIHELVDEPNEGGAEDFNAGLVHAIFAAPVHEAAKPFLYVSGWVIIVVRQVFREPAAFSEVSEAVAARSRSAREQRALGAFTAKYRREWATRTSCRVGFVLPGCSESRVALAPGVNPLVQ